MTATQTEHTFADLLAAPEDKPYELVRGLVEKELGFAAIWAATQSAWFMAITSTSDSSWPVSFPSRQERQAHE